MDRIIRSIRNVAGTMFLGYEMDASHNRSVLTFAGPPSSVEEAAFQACKTAAELIDMNRHRGEHPRIGATDVIPFIPLSGSTIEECIAISRRVAERIATELRIPTYLYERSAQREDRKNLSDIRKGEYEGLKEAIVSDPSRRPDFGEPLLHPTAGATVVGARPVLVAYNVYLQTADVSVAKRIAKKVRERDGGLPGVKALGFFIKEKNMAQVSMNLTDLSRTSAADAFDAVSREAEREGVEVHGSEIVGLLPVTEVARAAVQRLKLMEFNESQIIEYKLLGLLTEGGE